MSERYAKKEIFWHPNEILRADPIMVSKTISHNKKIDKRGKRLRALSP